jgi:hypothetical protein
MLELDFAFFSEKIFPICDPIYVCIICLIALLIIICNLFHFDLKIFAKKGYNLLYVILP